ncbi:ATP-binding cassette domain-containing protein [Streptomyces zagrosensis]|uniref:Alpha-D-ribose 1-methylphosphonate 5-triphosphate synthase subunit PhnL n=1 Tax=Streptomyces zagrosensis TaxID=1042984 RepID=A0A7W9Q8B2_9ACTN|nr:ATP-binding cassette domain-containing protein [Streptomyces zagrosensis]MBB5935468.1 alpha-D-ribose 1-methylphosphonate 5-triphosphate synthase subunit PhnL [Streptomyces zagrosensis]
MTTPHTTSHTTPHTGPAPTPAFTPTAIPAASHQAGRAPADPPTDLPSDTVLSVRGLRKGFTLHTIDGRTVDALHGVDLDVAPGEHVALAGTSGAGKSTLLRCVYRTYLSGGGSIWFRTAAGDLRDVAALPDAEVADLRGQEIGYVSQFLRPQPRRSVHEIVTSAGTARGMTRAAARTAAEAALHQVAIAEHLWDMHATVLSGGQKQRVNIAAGTIAPPRLLLLDEPVSALDPANRAAVLDLIARLKETGTAVLSVFHDLDAIERLATRVVVLGGGRVLAAGPPSDILRDSNLPLEVAR